MPGCDRTGPMGRGPMTGRGLGFCAGHAGPGYMNPGAARGLCHGGGHGWRNRYWATGVPGWAAQGVVQGVPAADAAAETAALRQQADALQQSLEAINRRLADLEAGNKETD